ncbi:copper chaperone PCu(A)C [Sphingopyxis sp.]|uniref:copper chaperone PCu(A)C n=1 Tax=Sphingopyxis sp. TaxID=1908224 RepID=UPI001DB0ACF8|nr:copper chaperone PCu(A)C [Sphingopyxis sp.]MBW8294501.1 copper chaperone PCu(A)C [Sphingopyxis sp.]
MKILSSITLAAAAAVILAGAAPAETNRANTLVIKDGWTRETAQGQTAGGGFMVITNQSARADRLMTGSSTAAAEVQIHTVSMDGGVMRMRQLRDGLTIPANGAVTLKPGSFHIMLMGLKRPLQRGMTVPITLQFERAGSRIVRLAVKPVGATGATGAKGTHHDGD